MTREQYVPVEVITIVSQVREQCEKARSIGAAASRQMIAQPVGNWRESRIVAAERLRETAPKADRPAAQSLVDLSNDAAIGIAERRKERRGYDVITDPDDIAQEAYAFALTRFDASRGRFSHFLAAVKARMTKAARRKCFSRRHESVSDEHAAVTASPLDELVAMEDFSEHEERVRRLYWAIQLLPPKYRTVVLERLASDGKPGPPLPDNSTPYVQYGRAVELLRLFLVESVEDPSRLGSS